MKNSLLIHLALLAAPLAGTIAQGAFSQGKLMVDRFQTRVLNNQLLDGSPVYDAEGSPYLNDEFAEGTVYVGSATYPDVLLRYNMYEDRIEFKVYESLYGFSPTKNIDSVRLGDRKFVVRTFKTKAKEGVGFLIALDSGKMQLFLRKSVYLKPKEEPKAMQYNMIPPTFKPRADVFYVSLGDAELIEVESIKKVVAILPDRREEVAAFAKAEKLSAGSEADLIKLSRYYNSLK